MEEGRERERERKRESGGDMNISSNRRLTGLTPRHPSHQGLSCLGRNPFTLRHTYLALSCKGGYVKGLAELRKFPQLQTLDLHDNFVESLKELEKLPYMTDLDVSSNRSLPPSASFSPPPAAFPSF